MTTVVSVVLAAAALMFAVAVGVVIGLAVAPKAARPVPDEATVAVDDVAGVNMLADLTSALNRIGDPVRTRETIAGIKDPALLGMFVNAAVIAIVHSDEMTTRLRALADEMTTSRLWSLPDAEPYR